MQNLKFLLPFVFLASVFVACNKDGFFSSSPTANVVFAGRVIDEDGQPISGAQVRVEGEAVSTDENGVFRLPSMRLPSDDAKLLVNKIGYFEFSRAFYIENGALQNVSVQLLRKEQTATLNGATGGTVQLGGASTLLFPAGAFADERGNPYNGTVRVFARRLDPSSPDFALSMPGDLRGINVAGDEQALGNYGLVAVELQGQSGQDLRIRDGQEVEIRLPIPASMFATAPSEVSLWYYDVAKARWMEDGKAQRNGNEYVGRVRHFTFWSFSTAFNLVQLEGKVLLSYNMQPLKNAVVRLTMMSDSTKGYASTNANGMFKGGVPMGETFVMDILNECGEVIYTENIGPFDVPTVLPDVLVPNTGTQTVEITGRLLDCSGAPIKNGYAQVLLGNYKWVGFTAVDGSFSIIKLRCDTTQGTGLLIGFDLQNQKQSAPDTISVPPNGVVAGDLTVCDSLGEFIKFSLDYNDFVIAVPVGGIKDNGGLRTFLNGYSTVQQDVGISMEFANDAQPGSFPLTNLYVNTLTWNSGASGVIVEVVDAGTAVGDLISGTFDGTFVDQLGFTHTLSGSFQVKRDY